MARDAARLATSRAALPYRSPRRSIGSAAMPRIGISDGASTTAQASGRPETCRVQAGTF
ncbi:hypothetical protein DAA51_19265 [Bradyrhizobium sp. WBAH10]|nr:hypothetical protein [Bradyrhizobium sp. WBAH30]MDD1541031.1 hypothetical protein [Bradyrhizobium sp. WBAH41]MDD1557345.1 hypothetical protein [Bradyrhizobium sp. WBAH23]MDD1563666.1 hypothetical protein [Bradyrhizobium sp. WBAH33]MDD1590165.1 hypothetical protein [Bradyrhizobium sp. WBAH42]QCJ75696.1 hypothetical protein DAA51_19265 [Bradyrhizobium sp. WBAH10]QCJ90442.1 hypothetical protein DAA57_19460 [Bradyrhizobium yuanmingense]